MGLRRWLRVVYSLALPLFCIYGQKKTVPFWAKIWRFWGIIRGFSIKFKFYNPEKAHHCVISRLMSYRVLISINRSDLYASLRKKDINKKGTKTLYFTHMPRSPQWKDLYQIWFRVSSRGRNQICGIFLQSAYGFRFCEGSKFAIFHWLGRSPLTQCWRYRAACDEYCKCYFIATAIKFYTNNFIEYIYNRYKIIAGYC